MEKKWRAFNDFLVGKKNGNESWRPSACRTLALWITTSLAFLLIMLLVAFDGFFTDLFVAISGVVIASIGLHTCNASNKNAAFLAFGVYFLMFCVSAAYLLFTIILACAMYFSITGNGGVVEMKANAQLLVTCAYAFIAMLYGWVQVIASKESEECKRFLEEDSIDDGNAS